MRFRSLIIVLLLIMLVPLTLAQQHSALDGTTWQLVSIGENDILDGTTPTLEFGGDNSAGGQGSCNSFGSSYTVTDNGGITFTEVVSTMMACMDNRVMDQEMAYLAALQSATAYEITEGQLIITGEQTLVFDRVLTLPDTQWRLVSIDNTEVIANTPFTLQFDAEGRAAGKACNYFGGSYTSEGDTLSFGPIERTAMACLEEGIMTQEEIYFAALQAATRYTLEGDTLTIFYNEQGVPLVFERLLDGTTWRLESIDGTTVNAEITLHFEAGSSATGQGGCNQYSTTYTLAGNTIRFEPVISTRMACDGVMQLENSYFNALANAAEYALTDDTLTITTTSGETLVFVPAETVSR